jgi:hypothetical protein
VLLSKNKEDCRPTESQIQYAAKLLAIRDANPAELEKYFPNVDAAQRWGVLVCLYWSRKLDRPFSLSEIKGVNARRYNTVQEFAALDPEDEELVFRRLVRDNARIILDVVNNAEPPEDSECSQAFERAG